MNYRSQLFVPGNRPDRFHKAVDAGADLVCVDLEDAVAVSEKEAARKTVIDWLAQTNCNTVSLRINSVDTAEGQADIKALAQSALTLPFLMIPKVTSFAQLEALDNALAKTLGPFFAIIETAAGLVNCEEVFAHPRVSFGMYGAIDYAGDVGCDTAWDTHLYARSRLVAAAKAFNVELFDTPHTDVRDLEALESSTRQARALGIFARSAIHPAQIDVIHNALRPTDDEVKKAQRIMAAFEAAGGNVVLLDGKFVEAPIVKQAERILSWGEQQAN